MPVCSKIFERLISDEMSNWFIEIDLISSNQSVFRPGDSCVNQSIAITNYIFKLFDAGLELDISKAFDKSWHKPLVSKCYFWESMKTFTEFPFLSMGTSSSELALLLGQS